MNDINFDKQIVFTIKIDRKSPTLKAWNYERLGELSDSLQMIFSAIFGEGFVYSELSEENEQENR